MARRLGLPVLSLDDVAWIADGTRAPRADSAAAVEQFMAAHREWVVEGCYGNLVEVAAARCTELRFLNPGAEVCLANARSRPWEPGYCASPEEEAALLAGPLTEFILGYEHRADECGLVRHRATQRGTIRRRDFRHRTGLDPDNSTHRRRLISGAGSGVIDAFNISADLDFRLRLWCDGGCFASPAGCLS
ncbi:MAG TPA: hypothetical protein VML55_16820 [Planctomycetaceae bacterium]|nr:hypothetical protein [Planctomycetaceae bacterium]